MAHGGGVGQVLGQHAPGSEEGRPIVLAAAGQGQHLLPGIGHVAGDIEAVLEEPHAREGRAQGLALVPARSPPPGRGPGAA